VINVDNVPRAVREPRSGVKMRALSAADRASRESGPPVFSPGRSVISAHGAQFPVAATGREASARPPPPSPMPSELHSSSRLTLFLMVFGQREGVINYAIRRMGISTYQLVGSQQKTR
jgi:hypothetical protein